MLELHQKFEDQEYSRIMEKMRLDHAYTAQQLGTSQRHQGLNKVDRIIICNQSNYFSLNRKNYTFAEEDNIFLFKYNIFEKFMKKSCTVSKYAFISYETRLKIVQMVCEEGLTIKKTSELLGLKPSTARMILKRFRQDGVIFERKSERHQRTQRITKFQEEKERQILSQNLRENIIIEQRNQSQIWNYMPFSQHNFFPYYFMPINICPWVAQAGDL